MYVDPSDIKPHHFYRHLISCITPRPIAWVSSVGADGTVNLAPFSFFTGIAADPPTLLFSAVNKRDGSKKDTVNNIELNKEFVVNVVTYDHKEQMNQSSAEYAAEDSEFDACDLEHEAGTLISVPHVKDVPVYMECTLNQIVHLGEGAMAANVIIGNIKHMYIADGVLDERGSIDPQKLDGIGRLGGNAYVRCNDSFDIMRPKL